MQSPLIRVVVADDHPIVLDGLRTLLASSKEVEVVAIARSFSEVIEVAQRLIGDVVILDLGGMGGSPLAVVQRLHWEYPQLKILIFSSSIDLAPELLAAGAVGYVAKEELPATLLEAIATVVTGQQFLSPLVQEYLEQSTKQAALTPKELITLKLLAQGLSTVAIAKQMGIDPRSVQNYVTALRRKTGCFQRVQLVDWYRRTYGAL